jgi:hypothetical protein
MAASRSNAWFPTTKRWSEDDARAAIDAWKRSGLGARAFAREHGITEQRLYWWRDRLAATPLVSLVPGEIVGVADAGDRVQIVIRAGQTTMEVSRASAAWIAELVRALASST